MKLTESIMNELKEDEIYGLEDRSIGEIKDIVRNYIEAQLEYEGIDANIVAIEIIGSRKRGDAREDSDLDVVVEFEGDSLREDDLFNILNNPDNFEGKLYIDGIEVDINPILEYKSGNIEEYLKRTY